MRNDNIDWKEVEEKISLICYKFSNLAPWREDLAQELRLHAYFVSDNYYDLYRKAIDFWRTVQAKESPETPYFDLELLGQQYNDDTMSDFDELVSLIRKELNRPGENAWDDKYMDIAKSILDLILSDVDPRIPPKAISEEGTHLTNHAINSRINLSWAAKETGIGYKRVSTAMKMIEDIVRGLAAMKKIELPDEYFDGYYDE